MIALTQITNIEIFAFIAVLVYKLLSRQVLFIKTLYGRTTREFLGLRMRNFQGIIFILIRTNREIFKSALVYL